MILRVLLFASFLVGLQGCGCSLFEPEPTVLVRVLSAEGGTVEFDQIRVEVPDEPVYSFSYEESGTFIPLSLNHGVSEWTIFADSATIVPVHIAYELEISNDNPCEQYEARIAALTAEVEGGSSYVDFLCEGGSSCVLFQGVEVIITLL